MSTVDTNDFSEQSQLYKDLSDLRKSLQDRDQEIAELRRRLNEPRVDPLTGFARRNELIDYIETVAKEGDGDFDLSLISIDLDGFKNINDSLGHAAGDRLLKQFADHLRDNANAADLITRIGGDQFLLVMRESLGIAYNLAELIRMQTESKIFNIDGQPVRLTLSIGVAERRAGDKAEHVLNEVDQCVYAAKSEGRNRVITASDLSASAEETGDDVTLADLENRIRVITDRLARYLVIRSRRIAHHYKKEASEDGLTGIFNRGYLDRLMDRELKKAKTHTRSLAVAMVDLDDFGRINRNYNWTGGDLAIKTAASIIKNQVRANDWLARYGGDEIFVVMPDTDRSTAEMVAERAAETTRKVLANASETLRSLSEKLKTKQGDD
jgi:diguanylate cyclase (GGDEF)-like protein